MSLTLSHTTGPAEPPLRDLTLGALLAWAAETVPDRVALIAGENEFAKGTVQVKNLGAKSARDVPADEVLAAVREILGMKGG